MKITMITTLCGPEGSAFPGTVLEMEEKKAAEMIREHYARPYDKEKDRDAKQFGLQKAAVTTQ